MNYTKNLPCVLQKNEVHNHSQIILKVYKVEEYFCFSINCKLGHFVRSFYPTPKSQKYKNILEAQKSAVDMLKSWVADNRTAKKHLASFELIEYTQLELF